MKTYKSGTDQTTNKGKQTTPSKVDPSFKSKRYRDKLRTEVKVLESLLPVDRPGLHRKLDSQTVYRLVIAYLRIKCYFKAHHSVRLRTCQEATKHDLSKRPENTDNQDASVAMPTQTDSDLASNYLSGTNIFQILDGFLLVATVDGTILYVSDSVTQYLGFNQVDLMHRCIYGAVHPDDHQDLRNILEKNETVTGDSSEVPRGSCKRQDVPNMAGEEMFGYPVSFLCRMKCFSGNSAGYTKLQCTGKVQCSTSLPKTTRTSNHIVLLYCQPFMLNVNDVTQEVKQDVFWTKHDLDLRFKDIDKKAKNLTGYDCEELNERSFYHLVHPEDLSTCVTVHKSLTENTDVQTMYFRIQTKDGGWLWLHSRAKVICKNSKKFSIVMSHNPIRDEDSVFIQQASTMRRRYALDDLAFRRQSRTSESPAQRFDDNAISKPLLLQSHAQNINMIDSLNDEVAFTMHSNMAHCPSSWHALSDRHSPVLPSSHVAHKITQREKQLQFAEFKRRQQIDQHNLAETAFYNWNTDHTSRTAAQHFQVCPPYQIYPTGLQQSNQPSTCSYPNETLLSCVDDRPSHSSYPVNFNRHQPNASYTYHGQVYNHGNTIRGYEHSPRRHFVPIPPVVDFTSCGYDTYLHCQPYNFPPSPPPSPDIAYRGHQDYVAGEYFHRPVIGQSSRFSNIGTEAIKVGVPNAHIKQEKETAMAEFSCMPNTLLRRNVSLTSEPFSSDHYQPSFQSHANVRLSMLCNTFTGQNYTVPEYFQRNLDSSCGKSLKDAASMDPHRTLAPLSQSDVVNQILAPLTQTVSTNQREHFSTTDVKLREQNTPSCAIAQAQTNQTYSTKPRDFVKYDIEASVHMKIVENSECLTRKDVEMPLYGSFLEYLNEHQ